MHINYLNLLYPLWHVLDDSHACLMYITSCSRCCSIIKVCSYNLLFNKATSNNDTRYLSNNVCLTTHVCLATFLINGSDHAEYSRKIQFIYERQMLLMWKQERFVWKNEGHMASSFGGRLIVVVRQAEKTLTVNNINIF